MARPWAEMRQLLEEERLCPALRGRVRYFATRYRHAHDSAGRGCILVDGVERLNMTQETEVWLSAQAGRRQGEFESLCECYAALAEETAQQGRFTPWDFGRAAEEYCISPIGASLSSPQPLVRLLAVLDRRVGMAAVFLPAAAGERKPPAAGGARGPLTAAGQASAPTRGRLDDAGAAHPIAARRQKKRPGPSPPARIAAGRAARESGGQRHGKRPGPAALLCPSGPPACEFFLPQFLRRRF